MASGWIFGRPSDGSEADKQPEAPAIGQSPAAIQSSLDAFEFFAIKGCEGHLVCAERPTGRVVNRPGVPSEALCQIVVAVSRRQPMLALLVALTDEPLVLRMEADCLRSKVLSSYVQLLGGKDGRRLYLRHPQSLAFVSAIPPSIAPEADLVSNRENASLWETFSIEPFPVDRVTRGAAQALAPYARAFAKGITALTLLDELWGEPRDRGSIDILPLLRLLTTDELTAVAGAILRRPGGVDAALPAPSDDGFWRDRLKELSDWHEERPSVDVLEIGTSLDFLSRPLDQWRHNPPVSGLLNVLGRRTVEPRRDLCVIATARNEGVYLLEWIAHYLAIGADHIFLYSNNNDDGSDALLEVLARNGIVTWIRNSIGPRVDGQVKAYSHALSCLPQTLDYRWSLVVDLDEFLILNYDKHQSLPALLRLREEGGASAVGFSWIMFTPGGQRFHEQRPLIERFRYREPGENRHIKSAFQPRYFVSSWPHDPVSWKRRPGTFLNAKGSIHHWPGADAPPSSGEPTFDDAWIGHYFYKSVEEFIWKSARNRGGYDLREDLSFNPDAIRAIDQWFEPESSVKEERSLRALPGLYVQLERLRALEGVARAEAEILERFRNRLGALKEKGRALVEERRAQGESVPERMADLLGWNVAPAGA